MKNTKKRGRKGMPAGREYLERVAYEWADMEWGKHHPRLVESITMLLNENDEQRVKKSILIELLREKQAQLDTKIWQNLTNDDYKGDDLAIDIGYQNALHDIIKIIKNI